MKEQEFKSKIETSLRSIQMVKQFLSRVDNATPIGYWEWYWTEVRLKHSGYFKYGVPGVNN